MILEDLGEKETIWRRRSSFCSLEGAKPSPEVADSLSGNAFSAFALLPVIRTVLSTIGHAPEVAKRNPEPVVDDTASDDSSLSSF